MGFNADSADRLIGGRYALEFIIGRGGMGEVWCARHVDLKTTVAIKFLSGGLLARESTRKRFLIEAQVAAKLKTKHAVQVFDYGFTDTAQPYLVMELIDGETLASRIAREKRLSMRTTMRFLAQAARALERAHGLGIVHRDFKPENILITHDEGKEIVKIVDFGVAKLLFDLEDSKKKATGRKARYSGTPSSFSRSCGILGTPYYMSPEQISNEPNLGPAADIWAFGVVAFVCLTGTMPFDGTTLAELFGNITKGRHVSPRVACPELPEAFESWFKKACACDPANRFKSALEAAVELVPALTAKDPPSEAESILRALERTENAGSLSNIRVTKAGIGGSVSKLQVQAPAPVHVLEPPQRATRQRPRRPRGASRERPAPVEPPTANIEAVRFHERWRGQRFAIAAFVTGAVLALLVERIGLWLARIK